jgi:hypothetical protein
VEPRWAAGPSLAELLREVGWQVSSRPWEEVGGTGQAEADLAGSDRVLAALARRTPPTAAEAARLGEFVAARPSWVVALGQDAFLADLPGAAGRLSACDPGEAMRRAVAAALTEAAAGV